MTIEIFHFICDGLWLVGIPGFVILVSKLSRLETNVEWIMRSIDMMGKNAAKVLHRDDDKFQIDTLLEKYYNRHFELSYEEWIVLSTKCTIIIEDTTLDRGYRSAAVFLKMVCDHKLRHQPTKYKL